MYSSAIPHDADGNQRRYHALIELQKKEVFQRVEWLEQVDSTNLLMGRWLQSEKTNPPALVAATQQTAGKGRGGNSWFSPSGCLMFSLAWPLDGPLQSVLPLSFGMAIAKAIEADCCFKPKIKWPNDVYVDGKKISGILIEAIQRGTPSSNSSTIAIIGAGVNCRVSFETAPVDVQRRATSLHQCCNGLSIDKTFPEDVLINIIEQWLTIVDQSSQSTDWLFREWPNYDLLENQWVTIQSGSQQFAGLGIGIDHRGALLLRDASGRVTSYLSGTIVSFEPCSS